MKVTLINYAQQGECLAHLGDVEKVAKIMKINVSTVKRNMRKAKAGTK